MSNHDSLAAKLKEGAGRALLGGFIVHLALGTAYCWANNTLYVTSNLRAAHPDLTYDDTLVVYILALACMGLANPIGGFIERQAGTRKTVCFGGVFVVGGTFLAAQAIAAHSLELLLLTGGVLFGLGCGFAYTAPIVCCYRWLPKHKGLVSGVVVAGYGGGALIFDQVAAKFANPDNISVDTGNDEDDDNENSAYLDCNGDASEVCSRAAPLYTFLGACYAALFVMSLCLLVEAPSHEEENGAITASPLEEEERRRNKATHGTEHDKLNHQLLYDGRDSQLNFTEVSERIDSPPSVSSDISPSHYRLEPQSVAELVQLSLARLEALSYIFTATAGVFIAGSYKAMAVKHFSDDAFLSNVGSMYLSLTLIFYLSMSSFGNLTGRLFWGWSCDRYGWPNSLAAMSAIQTCLIVTYALVASSESEFSFSLWTTAIYFNYGGNFATYPVVTAELFGDERSGVNYGVIFMVYGLTSATCVYVITFFLTSGTDALVYSLAVIQATGTLLALALGALSRASTLHPEKTRTGSNRGGKGNSSSFDTKNLLTHDSVLSDGQRVYSGSDEQFH